MHVGMASASQNQWRTWRDSNPRHPVPKTGALSAELQVHAVRLYRTKLQELLALLGQRGARRLAAQCLPGSHSRGLDRASHRRVVCRFHRGGCKRCSSSRSGVRGAGMPERGTEHIRPIGSRGRGTIRRGRTARSAPRARSGVTLTPRLSCGQEQLQNR
jgi:hypothetical protein